jgi:CheY-like chemotaxis protein
MHDPGCRDHPNSARLRGKAGLPDGNPASAKTQATQAMKTARTVLVVDDNADLCTLIEDFLQSNGFEVVCARDGTEALDILDRRAVDLAVIDLLLPGPLSGDEVTARAVQRQVKVLTMSGALASDTSGRDLRHPHLAKPFRLPALLSAIETALPSGKPQG